ncbi:MAG: pyridoxal phosphate-dependent aminotransferase [Bacteroidia bacterium]|jgi:aspartate aminotransferase
MPLSHLAESLIGSEIIKLASEIQEKIKQGRHIYNFTIGDFNPALFPIPERFRELIIEAYLSGFTNYPAAEGNADLRQAVSNFIKHYQGLSYSPDEILISSGGRPLIYAIYRSVVDRGDKVIYSVPSWNNNHYTHFVEGEHIAVETQPENNFMLTAEELKPHIHGATLLALCSPLNPTGTTFTREGLKAICDLVVEENNRRGANEKKLYILFDQIYWILCYGKTKHLDPVTICPELRPYTLFVDGMSKSFAATGVRVGWAMGPAKVIGKMKSILSHIGAWSPMPEQKAAAVYLTETKQIDTYLDHFKNEIHQRLEEIHAGFQQLRLKGYAVDSIDPEAAIYLTIQLNLRGKTDTSGNRLESQQDVTTYILDQAGIAVVPFSSFGSPKESTWYRLSVGTCKLEEIQPMLQGLETALSKLN